MTPTIHIHRAQQSAARIQALADPHREPSHLQPIITPARKIDVQPANAWIALAVALASIVVFAAIVGLIAGILIKR